MFFTADDSKNSICGKRFRSRFIFIFCSQVFVTICTIIAMLQITCLFKKLKSLFLHQTVSNTSSIGFGEEIKKLCQKNCSVRMLIWSAELWAIFKVDLTILCSQIIYFPTVVVTRPHKTMNWFLRLNENESSHCTGDIK